jgi:hypothetical protein
VGGGACEEQDQSALPVDWPNTVNKVTPSASGATMQLQSMTPVDNASLHRAGLPLTSDFAHPADRAFILSHETSLGTSATMASNF